METKITAQVSTTFDYSEEYHEWLEQKYPDLYRDLLEEDQYFLREHTIDWDKALESTIECEVQDYLQQTLELDVKVSAELVEPAHEEGSLTIIATAIILIYYISEIAKDISGIVKDISEAMENININETGKETFSERINEIGREPLFNKYCQGSGSKNMPDNVFNVEELKMNNCVVNVQNNYYN